MAVQVNFRTAFNGFNREDVVRYIEYINAKHLTEVNQLNSELEFLRSKVAALQAEAISPTPQESMPPVEEFTAPEPVTLQTESQEPNAEVAQLAGRVRELFDQCRQLEQERDSALAERDEALAQNSQLAADLEAARNQHVIMQSRTEEELEAYRRAERTERLARVRAEQMYRQANGALADATTKVDDTATLIGQLSDQVIRHLSELQNAVTDSKEALRDAAATMYTIRPTTEEE